MSSPFSTNRLPDGGGKQAMGRPRGGRRSHRARLDGRGDQASALRAGPATGCRPAGRPEFQGLLGDHFRGNQEPRIAGHQALITRQVRGERSNCDRYSLPFSTGVGQARSQRRADRVGESAGLFVHRGRVDAALGFQQLNGSLDLPDVAHRTGHLDHRAAPPVSAEPWSSAHR